MKFKIALGLVNTPKDAHINERIAIRAIIFDNDKLLMVRNIKGDLKFPGGGLKNNEGMETALLREIKEETGYVNVVIGSKIGETIQLEVDRFTKDNYFRMVSSYYLCKLTNFDNEGQNLDDYEYDLDFKSVFITPMAALRINKQLSLRNEDLNPWVERETSVLEKLLELINNGEIYD